MQIDARMQEIDKILDRFGITYCSCNIPLDPIAKKKWNSLTFCFASNWKYQADSIDEFIEDCMPVYDEPEQSCICIVG